MTDNKELVLNSNEPLSSQQPKKVVHIEMFKAGPQISSTGQKMMFTEEDLDQVVGTYSPEQHEAPLIIGHDQTDSTPALGWVKNLWRKGKKLWGKVELTPKAEQLIKDGVFKKVSSSFYLPEAETNPHPGKLALRHLGLVSIPAVKGLSAFSEGEANDEKIIDLVPQSGKTVISFKEALETNNSTMTKKKISDKVKEVSVDQNVDHAEGSMTVNINIGGGKPTVYDDSGNQVSETGAPADYQMEYADDEEEKEEMAPEASGEEESDDMGLEEESDDMGLEEEGGEEAPEASSEEEAPVEEEGGEEPAGEEGEEDISGEMEDNDKKIASLAAEYEEDELFQALALKKQATSMMENNMSYAEAEGEKKEEEEEEKKEEADHAEEVVDNAEDKMEEKEEEEKKEEEADHSEEVVDNAEEEKEKEEEEEEEKFDMAKEVKEEKKKTADHTEEAAPLATESLDHGEAAIGDQSIDTLNARVAELEEELNKQRKLAREKEISSFAEGLYESGKLTEQVVPKGDLVRFMETLNYKNSVNFSETGKASQFDFMRGVLESLPSMVSFEEFATPASAPKQSKSVEPNASGYVYDPNTANIHADALSYAEENECDYLTAVKFVINNN